MGQEVNAFPGSGGSPLCVNVSASRICAAYGTSIMSRSGCWEYKSRLFEKSSTFRCVAAYPQAFFDSFGQSQRVA